MSNVNLGWLFYKDYYFNLTKDDYLFMLLSKEEQKQREVEKKILEDKINNKVKNIITQSVSIIEDEMLGNTHFKATTTYPGLILGSGNAHELPSIEGQAILGFSFDYTTGLPIIAGSSIKGVLRSAFKHAEYIQELLKDDNFDVKALETEIFDNGDIFFDAVVVGAGTNILGDDYLAPHGDDALKNPIPLRFIKVMPNVTFRFDFELSDGILSKSEKETLVKKILSDLGLGAKTNVGYGKFTDFKAIAKTKEEIAKEEALKAEKEEERLSKLSPLDRVFDKYENNIPNIINAMKDNEIEEALFKELAEKIKTELVKKPKEWEKAKQKSLKRKEYIQTILGE